MLRPVQAAGGLLGAKAIFGFLLIIRRSSCVQSTAPSVAAQMESCWVFNHMNKSGGQTVKFMLRSWMENNGIVPGLYDSSHWKQGKDFAETFLSEDHTFIWGAYTEGLRPYDTRPDCKWFTVFRHPVSRLLSAYYFCQKRVLDPLCAADVLLAREVDVLTFAEHWTNFGLRQFATAFVLPEAVMKSRAARHCPDCPGWFLLKAYLEESQESDEGDVQGLPDARMQALLEPVQKVLLEKYAAVGVMEEYNNTLHLFNDALEVPDFDWPDAFRALGVVNEDKLYRLDIVQAQQKVMTDARIKQLLQLDLLLYEHAVAVHKTQVAHFGIG